jgi:hypothetical protein
VKTGLRFHSWLRAQAHRQDPVGDAARSYVAECLRLDVSRLPAAVLRHRALFAGAETKRALAMANVEYMQWWIAQSEAQIAWRRR